MPPAFGSESLDIALEAFRRASTTLARSFDVELEIRALACDAVRTMLRGALE